ncbi:PREDICTED: cip1-interacting zinc finger protein [Nanorana parkeri]|uniref:cip1-interacting zinc finger protein n=1 Tax=Nanorana parkeri TaxID=125878 RepID=UPI000854AA98|nr:PREDICTED: cip1-interacting zinc finger protein [Nanorana parkeri]
MSRRKYKASLSIHLLNAAKACVPALWRSTQTPSLRLWFTKVNEINQPLSTILRKDSGTLVERGRTSPRLTQGTPAGLRMDVFTAGTTIGYEMDSSSIPTPDVDFEYIAEVSKTLDMALRSSDYDNRSSDEESLEPNLDEGSLNPSNIQDVPIWLLSLILVAISGILIVLAMGCLCLLRTYLNHRSRIDKIMPVLESVIIDNREIKEERKHHFVPSHEALGEMMDEILEEKQLVNMFNQQQQQQQQQQQFHQLIQLQHLLQQHQQTVQPAAHHPPTTQHHLPSQHAAHRPIPNAVQQQHQMLNLRQGSPARLLNTHPMIQRALLMQQMQGNLRGLSMVAPPMPPFFPTAARHSILGIPPMGVTVKGPSMTFPPLPFTQPRHYHKDHYKGPDTKRDYEPRSSLPDTNLKKMNAELAPTASEADENITSEDAENRTECSITDPLEPSAKRARRSESGTDEASFTVEGTSEKGTIAEERSVESQSPEGVSGGRALKVTIQLRSESRTTALQPTCHEKNSTAGSSVQNQSRFCCCVCKTSYHSLQNFQSHLATVPHQHKLQEIEHMSNACLVTLLPTARENQGSIDGRDGRKKQPRWCNVCQVHFSCDLIKHRRTQEHKMAKRSLRPFCTVCSRHFKTPRKFVEHVKSPEHKQKSQEVKLREKEPWNMEESEDLITVDAVGCFEEEDDDNEEEEGISADETAEDIECLTVQGADRSADHEEAEEYNPDTAYGLDYMVPVEGYLCRLCHKFYPSDSAARLTHCKSLVHFQNIQRYKALKNRITSQGGVPLNSEDEREKTASVISHRDEDVITLAEKSNTVPAKLAGKNRAREMIESGIEYSNADIVVGTSEEDSGYVMEPELALIISEHCSEGEKSTVDNETSYGDGTLSPIHHELR